LLSDVITPDLFAAAVRIATPIALAAIGGTICERSGVVNIALGGHHAHRAFFGTAVVLATGSPWLGVLVAVVRVWLLPRFTLPVPSPAAWIRSCQVLHQPAALGSPAS